MKEDIIGSVRMINADCMDILRLLPDNSFDLAVVDPPYGISGSSPSRIAKYGQIDCVNDWRPTVDYFNELFRVSKNQIIWGYNHLSDMLPKCKEFIFWYKHQPVKTYAQGELAWTSFPQSAKVFDYPYYGNINADKNRIHPTQKPIKLYEWILVNYAQKGDRIIDTHNGSGSINIACENLGYELTAIEMNPGYYEGAKNRLINYKKQLRLF